MSVQKISTFRGDKHVCTGKKGFIQGQNGEKDACRQQKKGLKILISWLPNVGGLRNPQLRSFFERSDVDFCRPWILLINEGKVVKQ